METKQLFGWNEAEREDPNGIYYNNRLADPLPDQLDCVRSLCQSFLKEPPLWIPRYAYLMQDHIDYDRNRSGTDRFTWLKFVFENDSKLDADHLIPIPNDNESPVVSVTTEFQIPAENFGAAGRFYGAYSLPKDKTRLVDSCLDFTPYRCEEVGIQFDYGRPIAGQNTYQTGVLVFDLSLLDARQELPRLEKMIADESARLENLLRDLGDQREFWIYAAAQTTSLTGEIQRSTKVQTS